MYDWWIVCFITNLTHIASWLYVGSQIWQVWLMACVCVWSQYWHTCPVLLMLSHRSDTYTRLNGCVITNLTCMTDGMHVQFWYVWLMDCEITDLTCMTGGLHVRSHTAIHAISVTCHTAHQSQGSRMSACCSKHEMSCQGQDSSEFFLVMFRKSPESGVIARIGNEGNSFTGDIGSCDTYLEGVFLHLGEISSSCTVCL